MVFSRLRLNVATLGLLGSAVGLALLAGLLWLHGGRPSGPLMFALLALLWTGAAAGLIAARDWAVGFARGLLLASIPWTAYVVGAMLRSSRVDTLAIAFGATQMLTLLLLVGVPAAEARGRWRPAAAVGLTAVMTRAAIALPAFIIVATARRSSAMLVVAAVVGGMSVLAGVVGLARARAWALVALAVAACAATGAVAAELVQAYGPDGLVGHACTGPRSHIDAAFYATLVAGLALVAAFAALWRARRAAA